MASGDEKKWNRPWSMEEMIENAENWSLAGDVALLNSLKAYTENLFTKTVSISDNVDNLLHNLDEVSLKLDLSQNEFQSLRNTQFIESRVYEDDETLDMKEEVKPEPKPPAEEEKEKVMRESVLQGLRVMDKYFEKIEVSISDSEDEESHKSCILRPKDLYADRSLPLVIGTEEWYKKWHVGLADSSSESESEKISETYSDSDSGDDLPKDVMKGSETSSELDFSSQTSDSRPVANSTFNDSVKKPSVFGSDEESDEQGSLPVKAPISNKNFAEQLAAKLGDVINEREDISAEINKKPIQPAQKFAGNLFSEEPPPLDDSEDTILPRSAQEGLFSGGRGLFDDNEDEPFWGQQNKVLNVESPVKKDDVKRESEEKSGPRVTSLLKSSQVSKGLFDSDSESADEDIFTTKQKQVNKPFLQPYKTTAPLFDEEPPALDVPKSSTDDTTKKKPVGGVSIFGKSDLFSGENIENILKSRQQDLGGTSKVVEEKPTDTTVETDKNNQENIKPKQPGLFDDDEQVNLPKMTPTLSPEPRKISLFDDEEHSEPTVSVKPKNTGLFDDDDDLFKDDLFGSITTGKLKSNLFDEDIFSSDVKRDDVPNVDLFGELGEPSDKKTVAKPKKNISLFSDTDEEAEGEEEEGLFGGKPVVPSRADVPHGNTLEGGVKRGNKTLGMEDEVVGSAGKAVEDLPQRQVIGAETIPGEKRVAKGLFEDSTEEIYSQDAFKEADVAKTQDSDLFGNGPTLETDDTTERTTKGLFEESKEETGADDLFKVKKMQDGKLSTDEKGTEGLFDESTDETDAENLFKETSVLKTKKGNDLFGKDETLDITRNTAENLQSTKVENKSEPPQLKMTYPSPQTSNAVETVQPKNVINLFGSSPPPDDDDWDTKSVQSSDNDDQFSYRTDYNTAGSSLFDNEPPSLGPNESSGIVPDQNTTRVDTDDSSFNPFASSSRRLSSDVFNEQQSQDSFFVTKNKTESVNVAPQLDSIPELRKSDNFDITPSGILEDLESSKGDNSVFQDNSSNNQTATSEPKKPVSLFDDEFDNSPDTEDLFSSVSEKADLPKLSSKRSSLFDNIGDVFDKKNTSRGNSGDKEKRAPIEADGSVTKIEETNVTSRVVADEKEAKKPPIASPGKLKHNLKINVNALMPGSAPPKPRELTKSHSLELPKEPERATPTHSSPDLGFLSPIVSNPRREASGAGSEKAASFEDTLNNVEVLHSVTKDRAKIPIKRRPSTRRGRQQAIQDATSDFSLASGDGTRLPAERPDSVETKPQEVESLVEHSSVERPKLSSPEFPPSSPRETETPPFRTRPEVQRPKTGDKGEIFPDSHPEKEGISIEEKPKSSIFESGDSDDELFGREVKKTKKEGGAKKKSLFNDSSSDEDLFSIKSSSDTRRKENVQKPAEKKIQKASTTRKLENIETDEDPLSSLLK